MGEREPFSPYRLSASRMNAYVSCGEAFRMKYVEGLPEQVSGSAALFGSVCHDALEVWAVDRSQDLVSLVAESWAKVTAGTAVAKFIEQYQSLSVEAMKMEKKIRDDWARQGKESKAPRMTGVWKKSKVASDIDRLLKSWLPRLQKDSPWRFTDRDPLPNLYDESLIVAKKYAAKWGHLPNALEVEFGFDVMWNGFQLNGYIDVIEPVLGPNGELERLLITDYKTYAREPATYKDWRQAVLYAVAINELLRTERLVLPSAPILICFDYVRLCQRKYFDVTDADVDRFLAEAEMYFKGIQAGVFLPAEKGRNPDFCPYPENCCLTKRPAIPVELDQEAA